MAQVKAERPRLSGEGSIPGVIRKTFRCTSDAGETSTVLAYAQHGLGTVLGAVAYSVTGTAQIAAASVVLTAKSTITVTHTANHTLYVTVFGLVDDVTVLG